MEVRRETRVEGPSATSTTRTTTYSSKTAYETETEDLPRIKPMITGRNVIIQRTMGAPAGYSSSRTTRQSMNYGGMMAVPSGAYATVTTTGVANVRNTREKEKKDMQDLNERFASYIEKVRFLEAQNKRLADELDKLKQKWGKETTAIKAMYQAELDEARRLLDESEKDKARLEIRNASMQEMTDELAERLEEFKKAKVADRETIELQNQQLSEYEAEINVLRRRIEQMENDRERDKKELARLTEALNRARIDLDNETLAHIDAENRRQTLEEEIEFLKQVHEQEMKELAALAYRDTTSENREFWKNEMGSALREIQVTYDEKLDIMRGELETFYNLKIQEFRTGATRQNMETVHAKEESKRLRQQLTDMRAKLADLEARNAQLDKELQFLRREYEEKERQWEEENTELKSEVAKLRAEMEAILKELQDLMDTKLGLELEIAAYRKLLEGEENRVGLKQVVESMMQTQEDRSRTSEQVLSSYVSQTAAMRSSTDYGGYSASSGGGGGYSASSSSSSAARSASAADYDSSLKVSSVVKGEMSAKTTYQRSAKGPVSISECHPGGHYVSLENTSRRDENLSGWKIKRVADSIDKSPVTLPKGFVVLAGQKAKIYCHKYRHDCSSPNDIVVAIDEWGIGANITTKLCNPGDEDRATHVQKTIYTS